MNATDLDRSRHAASPARWLGRAAVVAGIGFFVLFFVVPIIWLVIASGKSPRDLITTAPFQPGTFAALADNWSALIGFQDGIIFTWLGNSALYSIGALVLTLVTSIPAGYALALGNFPGRKPLLTMTLIVMLIPNTALVLPIFLELSAVNLIGTPLSVILPFSFFPFGVYLTYIYFSTSIPRDLLAAARIDGCGELAVFGRIALPLATPVVALVGFFSFVANWNNYFLPFLTVPGTKAPIQVGLAEMLSNVPAFNPTAAGTTSIQLPALALATLVSVAPVMLIFMFSQRFLVSGLTAGGTKE
ncbi:carbohydrate ABC transporter permease [Pengzhenrongella sicca]|uniref:Carbohydrate ABC transporter permease n=1 Tax=Pengzhenrongella sicca TaxID=2819238 RepID=A0A8A4ZBM9_9MICO|nr:carbohydrate ABC transporter permease [Pengzhenrongella sicca]QTE27897.1 carbohydrate ABC transporter permease [Pengzhenrongella sicca]